MGCGSSRNNYVNPGMKSEIAEGEKQRLTEGDKQDLVEGDKQDLAEGLNQDLVEGNNQDLAEALNKDLAEGLNQDLAEGLNQDLAEGLNLELAEVDKQWLTEGVNQWLTEGNKQDLAEGGKQDLAEVGNQELVDRLRTSLHKHFPSNVTVELVDLTETTDNPEELSVINSTPHSYITPTKKLTNLIFKLKPVFYGPHLKSPINKLWVCVFFDREEVEGKKEAYTSSPYWLNGSKSGDIIPCNYRKVNSDTDLDNHVRELFKTEEGGGREFKWITHGDSNQNFKISTGHEDLYWQKVGDEVDDDDYVKLTDKLDDAIIAKIIKRDS